ncbi:hypothetical protein NMY22_g7685 [Coprinellus aureogranulatus]|nr:hypothetical protein NMY22_g7685 [Coprinellus aureogranulatus]
MVAQYQVPAARINTRPNSDRKFEEISPFCVSANDLINPPSPRACSTVPGGTLTTLQALVEVQRSPPPHTTGDIGIYFLKEPVSQIGEGSTVECWVDDNYAGAKVIENAADIAEPKPSFVLIDQFVSRGSHFVECQLLGEEGQSVPAFKLIGIFAT